MNHPKTSLPVLVLSLALAGCAHAQQPGMQPGGARTMQPETITFTQPPATAWVGFSAQVENMGPMVVTAVTPGSPAAAAGFAAGDTILAVDGRDAVKHRTNFRTLTPEQHYVVRVKRGAEERDLTLVPAPPRSAPDK